MLNSYLRLTVLFSGGLLERTLNTVDFFKIYKAWNVYIQYDVILMCQWAGLYTVIERDAEQQAQIFCHFIDKIIQLLQLPLSLTRN